MLYVCYTTSDMKRYVGKMDFYAGLIAALGHDLNHRTIFNSFVMYKEVLAIRITSRRNIN